jgi:hypothetical protein
MAVDQSNWRQISNRALGCLGGPLVFHPREFRAGQHLAQVIEASGHAVQVTRLPFDFFRQRPVEHALGREHREVGHGTSDSKQNGVQLSYEDASVEFKEISFVF